MTDFVVDGDLNECDVGSEVKLSGFIKGTGNSITIKNAKNKCLLEIKINGNNNKLYIDSSVSIKGLKIQIGNHVPTHKAELTIGAGFSIGPGGFFSLFNSGNKLTMGEECMLSSNVTIRCGDSPHLLFDLNSGEYLDVSKGVSIGKHVWIGENVYITKKVSIPSECVVAACSVVTRRFEKMNCALAGNPAKVVKENIQWIKNKGHLEKDSTFKNAYDTHQKLYE